MPTELKVEANQLVACDNGRRAMTKLLRAYTAPTFATMRSVMSSEADNLIEIDRFATMDLQFLMKVAENEAEKSVRQMLLSLFPTEPTKPVWAELIASISRIAKMPVTLAISGSIHRDIDTLVAICSSLEKGAAPTDNIEQMTSFFKQVLVRCEYFLSTDDFHCFDLVLAEPLAGKKAMEAMWEKFHNTSPPRRTMKMAEPFKRFSWMLSPTKNNQVNALISQQMREYQRRLVSAEKLCDGPGTADDGAAVEKGAGSASSSSTTTALSVVAPLARPVVAGSASAASSADVDPMKATKDRLMQAYRF